MNIKHGLSLNSFGVNNLHTQHFSSSLIRFSSSESDSEVLLVFVSGLTDGQSCQAIDSFLRGVYINVGEILNSDWLKSYIYFPYTPTQPISKNVKKQEILWYELMHNYIPFLLKTSKGTRNFIRSMTLYVSMLFYPLYEVAKRCDCKIKLFHDPTVLLLWHPIQPPPKQHFQAGNKIIFIKYWYYRSWWAIFKKFT